jgi:uncharacterized membrane protein YeaQ/YmgE (transglycosylase-associated protein family)
VVALKGVLLTVRFGLEIGALAALAYWGFTTGGWLTNVVLGIGAPLLAVVVWGPFVSPKARYGSPSRQAVFEALVFGAAVLALLASDQAGLAIAFGAIALVDSVLVRLI